MATDFNEVSRSVWQEMRAGTAYQQPSPDTGEYTADFWGDITQEGINFDKLTEFVEHAGNANNILFNWEDYRGINMMADKLDGFGYLEYLPIPLYVKRRVKWYNTTPISYVNNEGVEVTASFEGRLNKRRGYIDPKPGYKFWINAASGEIYGKLIYFYENTAQYRKPNDETSEPDDFALDEKYWAIELSTHNLEDFYYLIQYVASSDLGARTVQSKIIASFTKEIKKVGKVSLKEFLYTCGPDYAIRAIDNEQLWKDFIALLDYDNSGFFSGFFDASNAVIKILNGFDPAILFDKLNANQPLLTRIYENIDGSQTIDGEKKSNKALFAYLLWTLQKFNPQKLTATQTLTIGGKFKVITKDIEEEDNGQVYLMQQEQIPKSVSRTDYNGATLSVPGKFYENRMGIFNAYFNPLDFIRFENLDTKTVEYVPAIYVKYLADEKAWEEFVESATFLLLFVGLLASIYTLGATSKPLIMALAAADIAVTSVDFISAALPEGPEKEWFRNNWDNISRVLAGLMIANFGREILLNTPKLVRSLKNIPRLLQNAYKARQELTKLMESAINDMEIAGFARGSFTYMPNEVLQTVKELKISGLLAKRMRKTDIVLAYNYDAATATLIYKGEVIAVGAATDIRKQLDDIFTYGRKEADILSHLDELRTNSLIKGISGIKGFSNWFDKISITDFEILWKVPKAKNKICSLIRHPGGLHEWLMCSRANTFKKWGVSMDEIKNLRTRIDKVIFKNPPGYHGGPGSTKAHNEIISIIDSSKNFKEFKSKLINWADRRLEGGSRSLPKDFFN